MITRDFVLAAIAAGGVLAASAAAQPLGVPPGRWWERPRVAEELGLSAEQKQRLDKAALEHARTMIDFKAAVDRAELDLKASAEGEPFDAGKVRQAFAALQQARMRLESERFELLIRVRQVLTAQQWTTLRELVRKRVGEWRDGGGDDAVQPAPRPRRWRN